MAAEFGAVAAGPEIRAVTENTHPGALPTSSGETPAAGAPSSGASEAPAAAGSPEAAASAREAQPVVQPPPPAAEDASADQFLPPGEPPVEGAVVDAEMPGIASETPLPGPEAAVPGGEGAAPAAAGDQPERSPQGPGQASERPTLIVRYGSMGMLGRFTCSADRWHRGQRVVIKSDRGMEIGMVVCPWQAGGVPCGIGPQLKGEVLRVVTHVDEIEQRHLQESADREFAFGKKCVADRKLPMKLVFVEHLFGGDRIVFYFVSESRVDFRALVRDLAHEFQTRIEMRQIGVRDEARLLGDYERCGRQLCCRAWIKALEPVSMKMAKVQKATLDPTKISGRCGRLMCCLRFEHATYRELAKNLPRKNTLVGTSQGRGKVVDTDVVTQIVSVLLENGTRINVPLENLLPPDAVPTVAPMERPAEVSRVAEPPGEAEPESEAAPEPRTDSRPEPRPESRPEPRPEPRPGPRPGPRPEPRHEPRHEPRPEAPAAAGEAPGQGEKKHGRRNRRGRHRSRRGGRGRAPGGGPNGRPGGGQGGGSGGGSGGGQSPPPA